jgi:Uma2 family endonuclease
MTNPLQPVTPTEPGVIAPGGRVEVDGLPVIANDMPILYEDEGQDEMGESSPHTAADQILSLGVAEHLRGRPEYRVFSNLNVYYHPTDPRAYVSPDVMVVVPSRPLPEDIASYRVGVDGPAPVLVIEILSRRSFQQQDLTNKPDIYAELGVAEYILVDGTGHFLPERLLLKRLGEDKTWDDLQDPDGGVTSRLGFRILIEGDNRPRVVDAGTGRRYLRPEEAHAAVQAAEAAAQAEAEARRQAEERVRALEEELARLRGRQGTELGK